jgi:transposase
LGHLFYSFSVMVTPMSTDLGWSAGIVTGAFARRRASDRRYRWVVERTLSWLNRFRRLKVRYERRAEIHEAFLCLGCALVCWKQVQAAGGLSGPPA